MTLTGIVPDLDKLYAESRILICPITKSGATWLQLVEAAYRRPMVSTQLGAKGLASNDRRGIIIRDDDESLAAACVSLLHDDAAYAQLGGAARARMKTNYAADDITAQIADIMGGSSQLHLP